MILACGLAGLLYGELCWIARRMVYQGSSSLPPPEQARALGAEDVWLRTADGVKIHSWYVQAKDARLATLFLHGNAGNIGHRSAHIGGIVDAGSDVLIIDYRGYGRSEGRPTERGLSMDADAGYAWLAAKSKPIVLHGESLGSAVAVELATRHPAAGLILEAPFTSLRAEAGSVLPVIGPLVVWSGFDSKARIATVKAPLLIIHGDHDRTIPYRLGHELYEAAPGPKTLWTVKGADHNDLVDIAGAEYRERLSRFYISVHQRLSAAKDLL